MLVKFKIYVTHMLVKWPECWYIWIWCLINKEHLNIILHEFWNVNKKVHFKTFGWYLKSIADEEHLDSDHSDGQANKDKHTNKKSYVILRKAVSSWGYQIGKMSHEKLQMSN